MHHDRFVNEYKPEYLKYKEMWLMCKSSIVPGSVVLHLAYGMHWQIHVDSLSTSLLWFRTRYWLLIGALTTDTACSQEESMVSPPPRSWCLCLVSIEEMILTSLYSCWNTVAEIYQCRGKTLDDALHNFEQEAIGRKFCACALHLLEGFVLIYQFNQCWLCCFLESLTVTWICFGAVRIPPEGGLRDHPPLLHLTLLM